MSKPFAPDISDYDKLLPFFEDFYALNKKQNKKFSYQFLANKLGWSAPYLNDIFKGRKRLSLTRALEFMELLGLRGVRAERFLTLFLAESDASFSKSRVMQETLAGTNTNFRPSTENVKELLKQFETIFEYYILFYLHYNKGAWNTDKFLSELTLTSKPTNEWIERVFQKLVEQERVTFQPKSQTYKVETRTHDLLHFDPKRNADEFRKRIAKVAQEHSAVFYDYLENPLYGKSSYVVGTVSLDPEAYQEARARISALHNYLIEASGKCQARFDEDANAAVTAENRIWQYQINIFSVFEDPAAQKP